MIEHNRFELEYVRGKPNFWDNVVDLADCYLTCEDVVDLLNALHEENKKLKEENKQLNHDLDLYEENNTNEVLNNLRIELTSRMNDCIEEFKE